jgi:hypothetical protein
MTPEVSSGAPRRKKVSAVVVSAIATAVIAVVTLSSFVLSIGGSADAEDAVHLRLLQEPFVHDRWIVPSSVRSTPPPAGECSSPELHARRQWLRRHQGIPVGFTVARVEIVNDSDKTLLVEELRLASARKLPPPEGSTYDLCPRGGGGPPGDQYVKIDFDQRPLAFQFFNERYEPVPAVDFSPSPHHPLRFWILATSSHSHVQWKATLVYSLNGETQALSIPEGRQPFAIAPG